MNRRSHASGGKHAKSEVIPLRQREVHRVVKGMGLCRSVEHSPGLVIEGVAPRTLSYVYTASLKRALTYKCSPSEG